MAVCDDLLAAAKAVAAILTMLDQSPLRYMLDEYLAGARGAV